MKQEKIHILLVSLLRVGALPPLLSLARFENGDLETQRYAVFALTNMSATKANHALMVNTFSSTCKTLEYLLIYLFSQLSRKVELGTVKLMRMLMDHLDIEIRNTCIFTIANFSSNTNNHPFILKENCIPKLVYLTTTSDKNAQVYIHICKLL